jgi:hypothetical protein
VKAIAVNQFVNHAIKEIKSTYGWDKDVQVSFEPEAVCMEVSGFPEPIVVKKRGKKLFSALRKVRKSILRKLHREERIFNKGE